MTPSEHVSAFERIRQVTDDAGEFWSARDLSDVLGYTQWRNFRYAVEKAEIACQASGYSVSDHFAESSKMITLGSGAQHAITEFH